METNSRYFKKGFQFAFKYGTALLVVILALIWMSLLIGIHETNNLNEQEKLIFQQLIKPSDINTTFKDIAGLDDIISSIEADIILPLVVYPHVDETWLLQPPKGVLLYGPPGCGKTLLAKAIAKEAQVNFINLELSTITDKLYGEPQKRVKALFNLAQKIKPCIIFIDEVDSLLRFRGWSDHEVTNMIKAQFMSLWDGLMTKENSGVIILGTTNKPCDIDDAILRRMPSRYEVKLPKTEQRQAILELLSKDMRLSSDVSLTTLAEETDGFSGSDLKELCRQVSLAPFLEEKETILDYAKNNKTELWNILKQLRNVTAGHFDMSLAKLKKQMLQRQNSDDDSCSYN